MFIRQTTGPISRYCTQCHTIYELPFDEMFPVKIRYMLRHSGEKYFIGFNGIKNNSKSSGINR